MATHAEAASMIGMREFWLSAPIVVSAVGVFMAGPAMQAAYHKDGEATFLCVWIAVPVVCYVVLAVLVMCWVAVSESLGDALAVPILAFIAPAVVPIFPYSAAVASFLATASTVAILAKGQSNTISQASDKNAVNTTD